MPRHVVSGIDKITSRDREMLIEATSAANAKAKAEIRGLMVTQVILVPDQAQAGTAPLPLQTPATATVASASRNSVKTLLLIAAVSNIVVGLMWASTVFGIVFALPLWLLCVFELVLWSKSDQLSVKDFANRAKTLGIVEVIAGLVSLPTMICGILVLVGSGKIRHNDFTKSRPPTGAPANTVSKASSSAASETAEAHSAEEPPRLEARLMAVLGYIGLFVIIPIITSKGSRFVRFHCNQGLVITLITTFWCVFSVVFFIGFMFLAAILDGTSAASSISGGTTTQQQVNSRVISNVSDLGAVILQSCGGLVAGGIFFIGIAVLLIFQLLGAIQAMSGEMTPLPIVRRFRLIK